MPSFEEARSIILANVAPVGIERVGLMDSLGRVIAEDVIAPWDMPLYDNSAMDGFAVRSAGCTAGSLLEVTGYIPAGGRAESVVVSGCAVRIMTGAPVPPGCDAVVPIEETEEEDGKVRLLNPVIQNQHVRFKGEDIAAGSMVAPAGTVIRSPEISMLASFNRLVVPVYRKARVAILSTGDELVEPGTSPEPGRIINSNAFSLAAAVREAGGEPVILGIARDDRESHFRLMREGLKADALITSAGVSAGDRDLVRDCLAELGAQQLFWKVDIKPGGPTAFAMFDGKPLFSLPGNPVSTMVTFEEFVRPALLKMMGHRRVIRPLVKAVLQGEVRKKPGKLNFLRVRLAAGEKGLLACSSGDQNTGILKTMLLADAIALLPADRTAFAAGDEVEVHILSAEVGMLEG